MAGKKSTSRTVFLHYADWCPHCKTMAPVFKSVENMTPGVKFVYVDEMKTKTPGILGYPTIIKVDTNGKATQYTGAPNVQQLKNWVDRW